MAYKWYILPFGGLYGTYHLLREPSFTPLIKKLGPHRTFDPIQLRHGQHATFLSSRRKVSCSVWIFSGRFSLLGLFIKRNMTHTILATYDRMWLIIFMMQDSKQKNKNTNNTGTTCVIVIVAFTNWHLISLEDYFLVGVWFGSFLGEWSLSKTVPWI